MSSTWGRFCIRFKLDKLGRRQELPHDFSRKRTLVTLLTFWWTLLSFCFKRGMARDRWKCSSGELEIQWFGVKTEPCHANFCPHSVQGFVLSLNCLKTSIWISNPVGLINLWFLYSWNTADISVFTSHVLTWTIILQENWSDSMYRLVSRCIFNFSNMNLVILNWEPFTPALPTV